MADASGNVAAEEESLQANSDDPQKTPAAEAAEVRRKRRREFMSALGARHARIARFYARICPKSCVKKAALGADAGPHCQPATESGTICRGETMIFRNLALSVSGLF